MKTPRLLASATLFLAAVIGGFAPMEAADAAAADCPSGYMCLWSAENYGGQIKKFSSTNNYQAIGLSTVESYYNHRTQRTWLHSAIDGSGSYVCLSPGARSSNLSGWQDNAKAVWLATVTNC